jgi:hypothetical protein
MEIKFSLEKWEISTEVNAVQPEKRKSIFFMFLVFNLDKSAVCKDLQLRNIPVMLLYFSILNNSVKYIEAKEILPKNKLSIESIFSMSNNIWTVYFPFFWKIYLFVGLTFSPSMINSNIASGLFNLINSICSISF